MKKYTILYAEDDETLAFLTKDNLEQHHFVVHHFSNGNDCLQAFNKHVYDVCILDVMMPGLNGFDLATEIRKTNIDVPILFLSAKTLKEDKLNGLRLGADDYLVKPFSIEELVLKIDIFIARSKKTNSTNNKIQQAGKFNFDPSNFVLKKENTTIELTQRESELLLFFLQNKNQVLKREQILTSIWGQDGYFYGRSLDVFISRLRKIFAQDDSLQIETLHGIGFKLVTTG